MRRWSWRRERNKIMKEEGKMIKIVEEEEEEKENKIEKGEG